MIVHNIFWRAFVMFIGILSMCSADTTHNSVDPIAVLDARKTISNEMYSALSTLTKSLDAESLGYFPALKSLYIVLTDASAVVPSNIIRNGLVDALAYIAYKPTAVHDDARSMMVSIFSQAIRDYADVNEHQTRLVLPASDLPTFERGSGNTAVGSDALNGLKFATHPGIANCAVGEHALRKITYSNNNIALGHNAGIALKQGDNNIYVGHAGAVQETGVMRIGTPGTHKKCYIAGDLVLDGTSLINSNLILPQNLDVFGDTQAHGNLTINGSMHVVQNLDVTTSITCGTCIYLPITTSPASGVVYIGGHRLHAHDNGNTFFGGGAGNFTATGGINNGIGVGCMGNITTGDSNNAMGYLALAANRTGTDNISIGTQSMYNNISGGGNAAIGFDALVSNISGNGNCAIGYGSLYGNLSGDANCAYGVGSLGYNKSGSENVALGNYALVRTTGGRNIGIGSSSFGGNLIVTGSNNICIGSAGRADDSGVMRFGTNLTHTSCFVAGIRDVVPSALDTLPVVIDSNGQLGSVAPSSGVWKCDVASAHKRVEELNGLNPVSFKYKGDASGKTHFGLIAEEVAESFDDLAIRNKNGEVISVAYHELSPLLLAAYQQQQKEIHDNKSGFVKSLEEIMKRLESIEGALKKKVQK